MCSPTFYFSRTQQSAVFTTHGHAFVVNSVVVVICWFWGGKLIIICKWLPEGVSSKRHECLRHYCPKCIITIHLSLMWLSHLKNANKENLLYKDSVRVCSTGIICLSLAAPPCPNTKKAAGNCWRRIGRKNREMPRIPCMFDRTVLVLG